MSAAVALKLARAVGIELRVNDGDLLLEATAAPPPAVLDSRFHGAGRGCRCVLARVDGFSQGKGGGFAL